MTCKNIYLGQKWTSADLKFGKGTIYLGGLRNRRGRSWRTDVITKISNSIDATLLVPETSAQLKGGSSRTSPETDRWQKFAIGSSTAIIFWFPKNAVDDTGVIDLEPWSSSRKVLIGKDPENNSPSVIKVAENSNIVIVDSLDGLIDKMLGLLNRE